MNDQLSLFDDDWLFEDLPVAPIEWTNGKGRFTYEFHLKISSRYGWRCMACKCEMPDYEPAMCCSGIQCGCHGQPIEPWCCSKECEDIIWNSLHQYIDMWR